MMGTVDGLSILADTPCREIFFTEPPRSPGYVDSHRLYIPHRTGAHLYMIDKVQ